MSEDQLNRIVKGAPAPSVDVSTVAAAALAPESSQPPSKIAQSALESKKPLSRTPSPSDPLSLLPSSPPQIYLNLLILEASLRAQYLQLRYRRRQHTFFLTLLAGWVVYFGYALFFRPREDGKGHGGSVYWVVDMWEKMAFMGGVLTVILIWGTGQWERGVRWPRRWVAVTNRGLRGMNLKLVVLRGPWWQQFIGYFSFLSPWSVFLPSQAGSFRAIEATDIVETKVNQDKHAYREGYGDVKMRIEDLAPGGDQIKLLLLPKPFSPEFRQNWEHFRSEYWERENERRAALRDVVKVRDRESAKKQSPWFWWIKGASSPRKESLAIELEASKPPSNRPHSRQASSRQRPSSVIGSTHSRSSSRSSTGTPEPDELRERRSQRRKQGSFVTPGGRPTRTQQLSTAVLASDSSQPRKAGRGMRKRESTLSSASSSDGESSQVSQQHEQIQSMPSPERSAPNTRSRTRESTVSVEEG